ncbi:MAG TPA: hypothetical protein VFZ23_06610 [Pyrinomonadaceae bacterium]
MANYSTASGFTDLVGSMVVTNNNVDSYTSDTLGTGTVQNLGGTGLRFNVTFTAVNRRYNINATANAGGTGYSGNANNNGPEADQETWSATASTGASEDSAADTGYGSGEDTGTKKAAI